MSAKPVSAKSPPPAPEPAKAAKTNPGVAPTPDPAKVAPRSEMAKINDKVAKVNANMIKDGMDRRLHVELGPDGKPQQISRLYLCEERI